MSDELESVCHHGVSPASSCQNALCILRAALAARDERVAQLEAGLRELYEARRATYPRYDEGADAQLAWSDRISAADDRARALLDPHATKEPR